ncbi:metal ABC transporter permease [Schnuerera sp.]|uniref:metal ABC transporter permease n=1 Tax=Schnuerera sp. TaxID=2794844 RepID=UPI002D0D638B|nr:metal ABC transporter permease [Schnuerera sp.]HSH35425.1 metal ABC transporter permease [Schnuerera sp.]
MLTYGFMQKSFIMGIMISLIAPTIGYFLVLRRQSIIGDTLSHVALSGAAFGMVTKTYPVYTAILFSILAALGIEALRRKFENYAELSLAIVLSAGVGLASVLISLGNTQGILSYLFGSLALVSSQDIFLVIGLGVMVFITIIFFYEGLFYISFDEESAYLAGVPSKFINLFFSILVALTVAISMRIVGVLLISSLMVLPVASSLLISKSFKSGLILSNLFGIISVIIGLTLSFYLDIAPGGTIVLSALLLLIVVIIIENIRK